MRYISQDSPLPQNTVVVFFFFNLAALFHEWQSQLQWDLAQHVSTRCRLFWAGHDISAHLHRHGLLTELPALNRFELPCGLCQTFQGLWQCLWIEGCDEASRLNIYEIWKMETGVSFSFSDIAGLSLEDVQDSNFFHTLFLLLTKHLWSSDLLVIFCYCILSLKFTSSFQRLCWDKRALRGYRLALKPLPH